MVGALGHRMRDIFDGWYAQAALSEHFFVVCRRCEQVKTRVGACCDLLLREGTYHDGGSVKNSRPEGLSSRVHSERASSLSGK
jgi:hypothetical protein